MLWLDKNFVREVILLVLTINIVLSEERDLKPISFMTSTDKPKIEKPLNIENLNFDQIAIPIEGNGERVIQLDRLSNDVAKDFMNIAEKAKRKSLNTDTLEKQANDIKSLNKKSQANNLKKNGKKQTELNANKLNENSSSQTENQNNLIPNTIKINKKEENENKSTIFKTSYKNLDSMGDIDPNQNQATRTTRDIKNFSLNLTPTIFSKQITEKSIYKSTNYDVKTRLDFLSKSESDSFTFNLTKNLKSFLGEFYTENLLSLLNNQEYIKHINSTYKKRTVIIGIDGMVLKCLNLKSYAAFSYLMENGSYSFQARSTTEGVSAPGWTSVLCSLYSEYSGVVNNSWKAPWVSKENKSSYEYATPVLGLDKAFPCIFDEAKRKRPETKTAFYSSWDFFDSNLGNPAFPGAFDLWMQCIVDYNMDPMQQYASCDDVSLNKAKNIMLKDFDIFFWYIASVDEAGHIANFCSPLYYERVEKTNKMLVEFFEFLKVLNILDKVNIIVVSDHGADRNLFMHGTDKWDGNLMVPLFMMGPDFKKNHHIEVPVSVIDIPPSIALAHKFLSSEYWNGKPVLTAFENPNLDYLKNPLIIEA